MDSSDTNARVISERYGVEEWDLLAELPRLRRETQYRAYLGEWIGLGKLTLALAIDDTSNVPMGVDENEDKIFWRELAERTSWRCDLNACSAMRG